MSAYGMSARLTIPDETAVTLYTADDTSTCWVAAFLCTLHRQAVSENTYGTGWLSTSDRRWLPTLNMLRVRTVSACRHLT